MSVNMKYVLSELCMYISYTLCMLGYLHLQNTCIYVKSQLYIAMYINREISDMHTHT